MHRSSSIHEDPLVRNKVARSKQAGVIAAVACAAVLAHGVAMATISLASRLAKSDGVEAKHERVAMEIIESEVEPEPDPEPDPLPEPEAEVAPEIVELTPEPVRKVKKRKARVAAIEPPPDPIDTPPPEPAKPIRRTIGLSLESTVSGGGGPAFNTGNSRLGQTSRVGNDANQVDRRKGAPPAARVQAPTPGPNRAAAHIPGAKMKLVRPKRISRVQPAYPAVLRAQDIEGTVVLRVHINAKGKVTKVDIVAGAKHDAFNESARLAALQERFRPATKNGVAIAYDITFSSRFRIDEA